MAQVKIGFNPQDRFMMAVGNTLVVVTQEGNVFGADVVGRQLQPVFQFSGAKIGFNPQDRFMMAVGNTLVVVTQGGNVFGADVVGRDAGPIFQVNENGSIPSATRDRLHPGDSLVVGGALTSQDGRFTLVLQGDGNLVLYWTGGAARWATGTAGRAVARASMQADGNLVLYAPEGTAVWASGTVGHPGAFLTLQNDGNGVIYGPGGPLWATNTATRAANDQDVIPYVFRLDKFHIDTTRAVHEDTDVVSFALKVGDQMFGPLIKHMGDVNNGDHSVGLQFGPIPIPSTAVPILLNYQILNSGHKDQAEIDTLLSQGADYLTKSATASGDPYAIAAAWIAKFFLGWLALDCDGPVAIDQIAVTGATLDAWTLGASSHSETRRYNHYTSQDGCGSSPDYKVTWSIIRQ
jgi:hypothetical protein